jgi:hypothetical protein
MTSTGLNSRPRILMNLRAAPGVDTINNSDVEISCYLLPWLSGFEGLVSAIASDRDSS